MMLKDDNLKPYVSAAIHGFAFLNEHYNDSYFLNSIENEIIHKYKTSSKATFEFINNHYSQFHQDNLALYLSLKEEEFKNDFYNFKIKNILFNKELSEKEYAKISLLNHIRVNDIFFIQTKANNIFNKLINCSGTKISKNNKLRIHEKKATGIDNFFYIRTFADFFYYTEKKELLYRYFYNMKSFHMELIYGVLGVNDNNGDKIGIVIITQKTKGKEFKIIPNKNNTLKQTQTIYDLLKNNEIYNIKDYNTKDIPNISRELFEAINS